MLRNYPYLNTLLRELRFIGSNHGGIVPGFVLPNTHFNTEPDIKSIIGMMPLYHREILNNPDLDVQYHISGYGSFYEEAMIKYMGESIERYASIIGPRLVDHRIEYGSYNAMKKKGKVMDLKYLDAFSPEQIQWFSSHNELFAQKPVDENSVLGWIKCNSLLNKDEEIYVPAQMMFIGYVPKVDLGEKLYLPAFTTGTASHKSVKKALLNAIVEYVQIDSFIINWYTERKCPKISIDNKTINALLEKANLHEKSSYDIIPLYMTLEEMKLPIFGVLAKAKEVRMPYMFFGVQGDYDTSNAMLRGIMESTAVSPLGYFQHIMDPDLSFEKIEASGFGDLDSNVLYYCRPEKAEEKWRCFQKIIGDEIKLSEIQDYSNLDLDEKVHLAINDIRKISEYAVYLDITPPEAADKGWSVMRVLIPELMQMCLPGFPYVNHPRMKKYGGIKNDFPHPLP